MSASALGRSVYDSGRPAGAADDSSGPAAAVLRARAFGSALGSPRSAAQARRSGLSARAGLPARGRRPELALALAPAAALLSA